MPIICSLSLSTTLCTVSVFFPISKITFPSRSKKQKPSRFRTLLQKIWALLIWRPSVIMYSFILISLYCSVRSKLLRTKLKKQLLPSGFSKPASQISTTPRLMYYSRNADDGNSMVSLSLLVMQTLLVNLTLARSIAGAKRLLLTPNIAAVEPVGVS
jgi:hypothetical protein